MNRHSFLHSKSQGLLHFDEDGVFFDGRLYKKYAEGEKTSKKEKQRSAMGTAHPKKAIKAGRRLLSTSCF
ncbi:MAG: hypothetical protein IKN72_11050 [Clostridia bacterium]|nr:hypothetical protein [Clostridia bacterium]